MNFQPRSVANLWSMHFALRDKNFIKVTIVKSKRSRTYPIDTMLVPHECHMTVTRFVCLRVSTHVYSKNENNKMKKFKCRHVSVKNLSLNVARDWVFLSLGSNRGNHFHIFFYFFFFLFFFFLSLNSPTSFSSLDSSPRRTGKHPESLLTSYRLINVCHFRTLTTATDLPDEFPIY